MKSKVTKKDQTVQELNVEEIGEVSGGCGSKKKHTKRSAGVVRIPKPVKEPVFSIQPIDEAVVSFGNRKSYKG